MNELHVLLKRAARRIEAGAFLARLHQAAIAAAIAVLALMLIDRVGAQPFINWWWAGGIIGALTVIAAIILWRRDRKSETQVALLVDERLDLREKLSTALHVHHRDDPFAKAAVEHALAVARDPKQRERVGKKFKVESPRGWWMSPLIVLVALIASMLPQFDLFTREAKEQTPDVQQAQLEVRESLDSVTRSIEEHPELREELADMLGDLSSDDLEGDDPRTPEQMRRDAIKRITDLNERLEQITGEKGQTNEALQQNLRNLETPHDGPGKELAEALQSGDFKAAREAMESLMEQLQEGDLTEEQQEQLAEQLQKIAEQLENLAQRQQELEDALERAGMDADLASDPDALREALENNEQLTEQQRQQLQQMAQAQQQAAQMCQGLGAACQQMAAGLQDGQFAEGGQAVMDQLSQMEQLQMMLMQAEAAANACDSACQGLGQGLGLQASLQQGFGMGMGEGQGGGPRPTAPTPVGDPRVEQAHGDTRQGDIIARMLVDGPQVVGESVIVPSEVIAEVVEGFEQGLSDERLPRKYHDAQKHYFGELERRLREQQAEESQDE